MKDEEQNEQRHDNETATIGIVFVVKFFSSRNVLAVRRRPAGAASWRRRKTQTSAVTVPPAAVGHTPASFPNANSAGDDGARPDGPYLH
ncbi:hypothetical protein EVAR_70620_1 [Eumeta japonica]|uniref:Uncharacterized protein n=1 Tax=Eumeta variegata TaxID=151549 RepID=A0A4C2A8Y9_EUMVA|nr:hypothetical protein EVAR_70620_1 [Eumeta japonica]